MKELLTEFLQTVLEAAPSNASQQAKKKKLVHLGYGRYGPEKGQPATHETDDTGNLVPIQKDQPTPTKPATPKKPKQVSAKATKQPTSATTQQPAQTSVDAHVIAKVNDKVMRAQQKLTDETYRDKLFGYVDDTRARLVRVRGLSRLFTLKENPSLSPEQKNDVDQLLASFTEIVEQYTAYTTTSDEAKRKEAETVLRELLPALQEKYKFFSNETGKSFKTLAFGMKQRHLVGPADSAMPKDLVKIFNEFDIDLTGTEQGDKQFRNVLSSVSKPQLGNPVAGYDSGTKKSPKPAAPRVRALFESLTFIKEKDRSIFAPTDDSSSPPDIVDNTGGQNARVYFEHSINNNSSLQDTVKLLRDNKFGRMGDAVERYETELKSILENFDSMEPEERREAVKKSYATMISELYRSDKEMAGSLLKNMAELNLYQQEIAGGDEAYLPASGTFPAADKLVVKKGEGTIGERLEGVSIKFGQRGATFGMPAQSNTIMKWHPNSFYHDATHNRPGKEGYEVGVNSTILENDEQWNRVAADSGYMDFFGADRINQTRELYMQMAERVKAIKQDIQTNQNRSVVETDLGEIWKEVEAQYGSQILNALFKNPKTGNINEEMVKKFEEQFGKERRLLIVGNPPKNFSSDSSAFATLMVVDSAIRTSDGFNRLYHASQYVKVEDDTTPAQLVQSKFKPGTGNIKDWVPVFRARDSRGGGMLIGFGQQGGNDGSQTGNI
jgi:hypothetical protein